MLIIKQSLKFLYSLLEFGYYQPMLLFRFSEQVRRAIVIVYAIVVMNFPAFRHWSAVSLFPNKNVFKDVYSLCSGMVGRIYFNITCLVSSSATFPTRIFISLGCRWHLFAFPPLFFYRTRGASGGLHINELTAINARLAMVCSPLLDVFKAFGCINHTLIIS